MHTDPKSLQFKALLREFILTSSEFATALAGAIVSTLGTVLTTRGDILRRGASAVERLALGTDGQFFKSDGTDAVWETASIIETWSWLIESPENRDYRLIVNLPYGGTVNAQTTRATAGTGTATGKINTTALGGTANSASTSEQTQNHTTANTFIAGDDYVVTLSGVTGLENLTLTVKVTRAI